MAVGKRLTVFSDADADGNHRRSFEVERAGECIAVDIVQLDAPPGWPKEEATTACNLSVAEARELAHVLLALVGDMPVADVFKEHETSA